MGKNRAMLGVKGLGWCVRKHGTMAKTTAKRRVQLVATKRERIIQFATVKSPNVKTVTFVRGGRDKLQHYWKGTLDLLVLLAH